MCGVLERKSEVLPNHLRPAGRLHQVQMLGLSEVRLCLEKKDTGVQTDLYFTIILATSSYSKIQVLQQIKDLFKPLKYKFDFKIRIEFQLENFGFYFRFKL